MVKLFVPLLLCCTIFALSVSGQGFNEKHRLQLHYSVPSGWMNDPNGLIYSNGYYHLFYQFTPDNLVPGPLYWGHARSKDLIHFEHMPIALEPFEQGDIFSGCCVMDKDNVTEFEPTMDSITETPMIAIFSINKDAAQSQGMAYSFDHGLTWTQYEQNPILPNPGIPDFRDPNIFERNGQFYMTLAVADRISFYSSTDLKTWEWVSDFVSNPNDGDLHGVWECPALVTLKDEQNNEHDVLLISRSVPEGRSSAKYFIGQFDGTRFNEYDASRSLWMEDGFDNYAAVPFLDDPLGRVIIIGWMSNWQYANNTPASTWRGQMAIPHDLSLQTVNGELHLVQRPIDALQSIVDSSKMWSLSRPLNLNGNQTVDLTSKIPFKTNSMFIMEYAFDIGNVTDGKVSLRFGNRLGEFISFNFNINQHTYELDRHNSGDVSFHPGFAATATASRISHSKLLSGMVILDSASIEVFTDGGLNVFTSLFFPTEPFEQVQVIANAGKPVTVQKLTVTGLNSIWPK